MEINLLLFYTSHSVTFVLYRCVLSLWPWLNYLSLNWTFLCAGTNTPQTCWIATQELCAQWLQPGDINVTLFKTDTVSVQKLQGVHPQHAQKQIHPPEVSLNHDSTSAFQRAGKTRKVRHAGDRPPAGREGTHWNSELVSVQDQSGHW